MTSTNQTDDKVIHSMKEFYELFPPYSTHTEQFREDPYIFGRRMAREAHAKA